MLGEAKVDEDGNVIPQKDSNMMNLDKESDDHEINVRRIFFLFLCFPGTLIYIMNL
jgi:hypothetical protein